jgi:hypothetical protein
VTLYNRYVDKCVKRIIEGIEDDAAPRLEPLELAVPVTALNMVKQLTVLLDCLIKEETAQ